MSRSSDLSGDPWNLRDTRLTWLRLGLVLRGLVLRGLVTRIWAGFQPAGVGVNMAAEPCQYTLALHQWQRKLAKTQSLQ